MGKSVRAKSKMKARREQREKHSGWHRQQLEKLAEKQRAIADQPSPKRKKKKKDAEMDVAEPVEKPELTEAEIEAAVAAHMQQRRGRSRDMLPKVDIAMTEQKIRNQMLGLAKPGRSRSRSRSKSTRRRRKSRKYI